MRLRRRAPNRSPYFRRPRKRNLVHIGVFHQRFARGSIAGNNVHRARGQSHLNANFRKRQRRERCEFSRLQNNRIPRRKRRRNFPGQHQQREIPRNNLPNHSARRVSRKFPFEQLRPARVVIKMSRHQRDINVAALANRLSIVNRFEHRKPPRMFLYLSGNRVQIARPRMRRQSLPHRQSYACRPHRRINVRRAPLCHFRNLFSRRGIRRFKIFSFDWGLPFAPDKMSKSPFVAVEPHERLFRVLRRRTVLHRFIFFEDAHIVFSHAIGWRYSAEYRPVA